VIILPTREVQDEKLNNKGHIFKLLINPLGDNEMIKSELRRVLDIVADLSQNDVKKDVLETEIISQSGLSDVEVRNYLGELEWLNLVKEAQPRPSHAEYRLWSVTEKGLQDRSHQDHI
jgi:predicted transcriptional regulator